MICDDKCNWSTSLDSLVSWDSDALCRFSGVASIPLFLVLGMAIMQNMRTDNLTGRQLH